MPEDDNSGDVKKRLWKNKTVKDLRSMRIAQNWKEYKIIDTTSQEKLESWNGNILIRPDPQIIWKTPKKSPLWDKAMGHYHRSFQAAAEAGAFQKNLQSHGRCLIRN